MATAAKPKSGRSFVLIPGKNYLTLDPAIIVGVEDIQTEVGSGFAVRTDQGFSSLSFTPEHWSKVEHLNKIRKVLGLP